MDLVYSTSMQHLRQLSSYTDAAFDSQANSLAWWLSVAVRQESGHPIPQTHTNQQAQQYPAYMQALAAELSAAGARGLLYGHR